MADINDLFGQADKKSSGSGVTSDGAVEIGSIVAGQPTEIKTSSGEAVVTVTDDGEFQLSETQAVREIVNAIVVGADNNDKKLATVQAIATFVAGAVTASIDFKELTSKAAFDAFISAGGFVPTIAFVTDTTPFDYTDNTGHSGANLTWMFVVCVDDAETITTSMINNSDISNLTGDEIAAIIAVTEDVNFVNDSQLFRINNLPDNTIDVLNGKVGVETGKGLSQNNFTDSQRSKVDNLPTDTNSSLAGKLDKQSSGVNVVIDNPGTGNGTLKLKNSGAEFDQQDYILVARSDGDMDIEALDDGGDTVRRWTFSRNGGFNSDILTQNNRSVVDTGDTYYQKLANVPDDTNNALDGKQDVDTEGNITVIGDIKMFDTDGHEHRFEHGIDGIALRALSNPASGEPIFTIASSGDSKRLMVPHEGDVTTSNVGIRVNTDPDGTGGHPVLTPENFGEVRGAHTYFDSMPSLGASDVSEWFRQGADIEFISVGSGVIDLPQIVGENPDSGNVLANSHIYITNSNSGSSIFLNRFNTGQIFMVDNVSNFQSTIEIFPSSRIMIKALDTRGTSSIQTNWTWSVRGV